MPDPTATPASFADPAPGVSAEQPASVDEDPPLVAEVKTKFADRFKARSNGSPADAVAVRADAPVVQKSTTRDRPSTAWVNNPAAGEINLKLSYWGVIAIASILIVVLSIAYIAGSQRGKSATEASSTTQPSDNRSATLSATGPVKTTATVKPAPTPDVKPSPTGTEPTHGEVLQSPPSRTAPAMATAREVGKHYFVIQSYPERDLAEAQRMRDALNRDGVPCSLIQGPKGYVVDSWWSLIGLDAIPVNTAHPKEVTPQMIEYARRVNAAYAKAAPHAAKPVQQWLYPWQADSDRQ